MKAVIMAGGLGTRLRPLTDTIPKPMVPIHGRPCMEYAVELLKKHGIKDIAATLYYHPEKIKTHFSTGENHGIAMRYYLETEPLGTAGSVKQAEDFLKETFLVISGDGITDIHLTKAIRFHKQKKALATMVLTKVPDPSPFGIVVTDEQGKITRFIEKPKPEEIFTNTINTGIYVFEPEIFNYIPPKTYFDFSKNLFPALLEQNLPFYGMFSNGYWCDIGTKEQYRQVQIDIANGMLQDFDLRRQQAI